MFCLPDVDNVDDNHVTSRSLSISLARLSVSFCSFRFHILAFPSSTSSPPAVLFPLVYLLVLTRFGLSRQAAFAFCLLLYFYYFRQPRFAHPLSALTHTHSHSHTHAHTRAYTHVSKNRLRFIVLLNLVDFCWRLIFCGFSFSFPFLFSFLAFEFTANLLQIVCKVGSPFAPRCYSKLKSSAKKI